ncbi:hypothetical protein [Nonomuraea sp. NPDC049400]|uniref:hypothetical protein n=1 Tax=Nonomuraea sp. NPDC049400 TaxID=3364352 RepID=UPI0037A583F3
MTRLKAWHLPAPRAHHEAQPRKAYEMTDPGLYHSEHGVGRQLAAADAGSAFNLPEDAPTHA